MQSRSNSQYKVENFEHWNQALFLSPLTDCQQMLNLYHPPPIIVSTVITSIISFYFYVIKINTSLHLLFRDENTEFKDVKWIISGNKT